MNVLVIGGTLFFGIDLVQQLLEDGHNVTLATRGHNDNIFMGEVDFITLDRHNADIVSQKLKGKNFDVIIDKIACCSNDMKNFFDDVACKKYILMSTAGVYIPQKKLLKESDFKPEENKLVWLSRAETDYHEAKRQTETALFQKNIEVPSIAVRYPVVLGKKDYTKRLEFYVNHIKEERPMYIDNFQAQMPFIHSSDAGKFMAHLIDLNYVGPLNGASKNTISVEEIIMYIENRLNKKAVLSKKGDPAPWNGTPEYSLDISKAESLGYTFMKIEDYMFDLIDYYIKK